MKQVIWKVSTVYGQGDQRYYVKNAAAALRIRTISGSSNCIEVVEWEAQYTGGLKMGLCITSMAV